MLPLLSLSREQAGLYEHIWGEFCDFAYVFTEARRELAFHGKLDVQRDGRVALRDLLVIRSAAQEPHEQADVIRQLQGAVAGTQWRADSLSSHCTQWTSESFRLMLIPRIAREGMAATHLLLFLGADDRDEGTYLELLPPLDIPSADEDSRPSSHFYPVRTECDPEHAEAISPVELASRIQGKRVVAFTGAGVSLPSGIPTFRGPGGLEEHFPLFGPFPGQVTNWMLGRPRDLAQVIGRFQASFMTARPNATHFALAELESASVLAHLITGNKDRLHERAGSRRVHLKDASQFVDTDEGWQWIREGQVFLVIGVCEDEHGLIAYASDHALQVVAIAPERPSFLSAGHWFVQGAAEDVLPRIAEELRHRH
jgi:hypothetical protein